MSRDPAPRNETATATRSTPETSSPLSQPAIDASYGPGEHAAYLAAIVSSSDDAIVSKTLDGIVTSWNAAATRIFGYAPEEMIGQSITKIIPAELLSEEDHILSQLRRGERINHFDTERVTKSGNRIHVSLTISPVRDASGRLIGASKIARDVSDRKHAERLQQLLVSELNHRVKNTLATVQSIANQTVRLARSPAEFAVSFGGRVQALARAHSLLTSNTWRGTDMQSLIRDQLMIEGDPRISMSGPSTMLEPQLALHLALVIHELGTNAHKYGALSVPNGALSIRWAVRHDNEGRHLLMQWQERNGPHTEPPAVRGFGTNLIEQSLQAHGGEATLRYDPVGVTYELKLPLAETFSTQRPQPGEPDRQERSPSHRQQDLRGKRVLVVEDEPLVAMDIISGLADAGCTVVGPAFTLNAALALIESRPIDAALLDANLKGQRVDSLATALSQANIPFAFLTGYGREGLPQDFRSAPLITKPFNARTVLSVLAQLSREETGLQASAGRSLIG